MESDILVISQRRRILRFFQDMLANERELCKQHRTRRNLFTVMHDGEVKHYHCYCLDEVSPTMLKQQVCGHLFQNIIILDEIPIDTMRFGMSRVRGTPKPLR